MSDFHRLPIRFPATYDYGSRRGYPTRAVVFHMAEGTDVARYLSSGDIARGVSVHYTIEQKTSTFRDGQVVRILGEQRISGSIDPDTIRRTNDLDGFYGVRHARYALGKWWSNPNVAVISVEVAGRAKEGPSARQVASMVELFEDIERRYGRVIPPAWHVAGASSPWTTPRVASPTTSTSGVSRRCGMPKARRGPRRGHRSRPR